MSAKIKTILFIVLFFLFIAGSVLLYNKLQAQNKASLLEGTKQVTAERDAKSSETKNPETDAVAVVTEQGEDIPEETSEEISEETPEEEPSIKAPDFTVYDSEGNAVKLSDMLGKPVVLNFWASWCPPCKAEMPHFDEVNAELGGEIQFMMVDLVDGVRETVEVGLAYIEEQGYSFPVFFDSDGEGGSTYGIRSIPTTFFIDKEGNIVTGMQGAIDEITLREGIELIR